MKKIYKNTIERMKIIGPLYFKEMVYRTEK